MRGVVFILICAVALTKGASIAGDNEDSDDIVINRDPSEAATICNAPDSDGIFVANEICNRYYLCARGLPISMKCPKTLLYNYNIKECDWPENVECGDRVINYDDYDTEDNDEEEELEDSEATVNGTNSDPSQAPTICATEDSNGVLVAHEYCNYFYMCSGSKPVSMRCPLNLLYSYEKEQCEWSENVECGDRVINEEEEEEKEEDSEEEESNGGNSDPSEAPAICAAQGSNGILVASENCNKFYNCWNGKPVEQACPTDLLFDADRSRCDWPQNVDCGDRVIKEKDE